MRLVITEKPSVARDLGRVLGASERSQGFLSGKDLRIAWCFGHMAELVQPSEYKPEWRSWDPALLPMLPEDFQIKPRPDAADQLKVLTKLLRDRDTTQIVNACDAGREGELIFRYVLQLAKVNKPVQRLWVSSLTDQAITAAWKNLQDGARFDNLADAARCRAEADWLVGLNATRAMTCLARSAGGGQLLSVGRVQTPTLAMIVGRDQEIRDFVPEDFWQVRARLRARLREKLREKLQAASPAAADSEFRATWFRPVDGNSPTRPEEGRSMGRSKNDDDDRRASGPRADTRLTSAAAAQAVAQAAAGQPGHVIAATRKRTVDRPPLLYDLTSLQRRANQRYGLSAARTLELAQALYERHKLITYPRTDARFLTPDQVPELPGIVAGVGRLAVYQAHAQRVLDRGIAPTQRVIDASEVGDHHALLPTGRVPDTHALNPDEKRIYDLIARRLLAALSDDALFDVAQLQIAVQPKPGVTLPQGVSAPLHFRAKGRMRVQAGWQEVDPPSSKKKAASKQSELPVLQEGDGVTTISSTVEAGQTRPPPPHNDASILKSMETAGRKLDDAALRRVMRQAGLGTPATRAAILTTLERRGFAIRQGKHLHATDRGCALIAAVPEPELLSAQLTGRWEARLAAIADGRDHRDQFMQAVRQRTTEIVKAILAAPPPPAEDVGIRDQDDRKSLGDCPICGKPVREGRGAYSCDSGRACSFVIFKSVAKRTISKRVVKQLIAGQTTAVLKNFKSKAGKSFETALTLDDQGKVVFVFPDRQQKTPQKALPADPTGLPCPTCGQGHIMRGRTGYGCDRWRQGCTWRRLDHQD